MATDQEQTRVDPFTDRELIERCLLGDQEAWNTLFQRYQKRLVTVVRSWLRLQVRDEDLAEEIVSRVWLALLRHDRKLLERFDPGRGFQLLTYLVGLARNEVLRHNRSERRRIRREFVASSSRQQTEEPNWELMQGRIEEFLATLTPREREYCENHLLSNCTPEISSTNLWQLHHRVRKKLGEFLNDRT